MPGPILHLGATVICAHAGQASPVVTTPRVTLSGQPVATLASPYVVAGCTLPPVAGGPCVSGQFVTSATRVMANGQPVLIQDSQAICAPTGTPLTAILAQTRVTAI